MMIGRGSKDRGITRIESQPDDSPQAIEMITKLLREQRDISSATSAAGQAAGRHHLVDQHWLAAPASQKTLCIMKMLS